MCSKPVTASGVAGSAIVQQLGHDLVVLHGGQGLGPGQVCAGYLRWLRARLRNAAG